MSDSLLEIPVEFALRPTDDSYVALLLNSRSARSEGGSVLVTRLKRAVVEGDPDEVFGFLTTAFPRAYRPILSPAVALQSKTLGLDSDVNPFIGSQTSRNRTLKAELLTNKKAIVGVDIRASMPARFVVSEDGFPVIGEEAGVIVFLHYLGNDPSAAVLDRVVEDARESLGLEFEGLTPTSRRFRELVDDEELSAEAESGHEEAQAVDILAAGDLRRLAIAIRSSGGLLVADLPKQVGEKGDRTPDQLRRSLNKGGLVNTETVVVCRQSKMQTTRAPDRDALKKLAEAGVTCACGSEVLDEIVDEALAPTPLCNTLLDGSRWMSLLVRRYLIALGVDPEQVFVEQYVGADEIDCLANVYGEVVLFELKDGPFSLGHAYSFGAKMGIIQPDISVVVTSESVDQDVKDHFERSAAAAIDDRFSRRQRPRNQMQYIEGMDALEAGLKSLVTEVNVRRATEGSFSSLFEFGTIPPESGIRLFVERLES